MGKRIYLSPPHLDDQALIYLKDAVQSNWIAPVGPHVDAFEQELAEVCDVRHAVAANSGTSAIHLGLLALGVGKGDEVLCSTFTFCASANPIIYCGATPVFVDSEQETWNMDPVALESAIADRMRKTRKKPKAIVVVDLYGMPARMPELMTIARKYEIPVLEDAAEALGSVCNGRAAGTLGDVGVLSFNGNKIITTSGGGALISDNTALIGKARYFRQEAREPLPYYEHREVGYNYRLSNLLAAVGRSQLKVLRQRVSRRREIFGIYCEGLKEIGSLTFQREGEHMRSNRWLSAFVVSDARVPPERIRLALVRKNIESRLLWKPMHLQPVFETCPVYGNGVSARLFSNGLCLPSGTAMTTADVHRVIEIITNEFK